MKTFYDIHLHALNLGHVNLTAHLYREDMQQLLASLIKENRLSLFAAGGLASLMPKLVSKKIHEKFFSDEKSFLNILGNCLAFMEIPMEYQFLVLEHYLLENAGKGKALNDKRQIVVNGQAYDKIVLCPLVIDFGYKNLSNNVFYKLTPKRPIASQVGDLLYAIRTYYRFYLEWEEAGKEKIGLSAEIKNPQANKHKKLFEIYPFMGLDTRNYSLPELRDLLKKYFNKFKGTDSAEDRRRRLFKKMGRLDSNMAGMDRNGKPIDYSNVFAGIKLYPQLGFDPWPDNPGEREKVEYLYNYCVEKRIPITTHCSDGGYKVDQKNDGLTRPGYNQKWWKALEKHPKLTINFAHFGAESKSPKRQWRNAIIDMMDNKKFANVYADISCGDSDEDYYKELRNVFEPNPKDKLPENIKKYLPVSLPKKLPERLLFGSDFSINLLASKVNSYNAYLEAFQNSRLPHINNLCEHNPERFLFGK